MLQPHEERVVAEYDDLTTKVEKLGTFLSSPAAVNLSYEDKTLLDHQMNYMTLYLSILRERVSKYER